MRAVVVAIAIAGAGGCAGELQHPERFADCGPGLVEQIFSTKCGDCHGADQPDAGLDLVSAGVAERLLGVMSVGACDGLTLIDAAGGDHLLLGKLDGAATCGSPMPLGMKALTATETECVARWIDEVVETAP